jgi:hypothetical protein
MSVGPDQHPFGRGRADIDAKKEFVQCAAPRPS